MIGLKKVDETWKIVFSQRYRVGQTKTLPTVECEVIVLHACPMCKNATRIYFKTDREIPVFRYEEKDNPTPDNSEYFSVVVPGGQALLDKKHTQEKFCYNDTSKYYPESTHYSPFFDPNYSANLVTSKGRQEGDAEVSGLGFEHLPFLKKRGILVAPDFCRREPPNLIINKNLFVKHYGKGYISWKGFNEAVEAFGAEVAALSLEN